MVHDLLPFNLIFQLLKSIAFLEYPVVDLQGSHAKVIQRLESFAIHWQVDPIVSSTIAHSQFKNDLIWLHLIGIVFVDVVFEDNHRLVCQLFNGSLVIYHVQEQSQIGIKSYQCNASNVTEIIDEIVKHLRGRRHHKR